MKLKFELWLAVSLAILLALTVAPGAFAANPHATRIQGPIETGSQATEQCLKCHEKEAKDFMKTSHWTWSAKQTVDGKSVDRGKKNAINNFCVSIASNA